ncbi:MFS transporter [Streptomyces cadmiisoli]|uniref:MFS transporter n=1 Tax=Streptomyces cadmiisoli TaxID=2184053 RepID=A0A2Z4J8Z2_9ACTN|nr:MFS transporter [Streptomyces cadmiisoli]AWW41634.1 MFS transporter [Streptomyces cadmiisoli]
MSRSPVDSAVGHVAGVGPRIPEPRHAGRRRPHPGLVLAVLATSVFLSALDAFVVNVALTPIGQGVGETSLSKLSWILNGYAIVYAALLVPAGRLADRYGLKAGFLLGLGVFTVTSLGAALSGDLWVLVAFRFLQAVGAAVLTPASLGLVLSTSPPAKTTRYVQIWAASGSLAAAAGPVVGGLLVQVAWQWIFLLNLPIGIVALISAVRLLPVGRQSTDTRLPDLLGGALLVGAIGALALGLVQAPEWGWSAAPTIGSFVTAAAALIVCLLRSARHAVPVVDLSLLRDRVFAWANIATLLFYAAFAIQLLGVTLWLQQIWRWSAIETGLGVAPGPAMVFVAASLGRRLALHVPVRVVAATGSALVALGTGWVALNASGSLNYATDILPGWLVAGVGVGLALPTMISSATSGLPEGRGATGSAIVSMAGQLGTVLGVSVLVVILADAGSGGPARTYALAWWISAGVMAASGLAALGLRSAAASPRPARPTVPR